MINVGSGRGKTAGLNSRATARPFWPLIKNAGQCRRKKNGQTGQWKRTCPVSTCAPTVGHSPNADRTKCRPPKWQYLAAMPTRCHLSHMAIHRLAVRHGCQYSRSAFRHGAGLINRASDFYRAVWNADAV